MILGGGSNCQGCGCSAAAPECVCPLWDAVESDEDEAADDFWIGQMFYTGPSARIITSIQLRTPDWSTLANRADAKLYIYRDRYEAPGYFIPAEQSSHLMTNPTTYGHDVTFTSAGFTVDADTYYWAVLQNAGKWEWTNNQGCLNTRPAGADPNNYLPYCSVRWAWFSVNLWQPSNGGPYMLRVFGDYI